MILVDSSVWIDYLRGRRTGPAEKLDTLLGEAPMVMGDLILTEVLQGCGSEAEFRQVRRMMQAFSVVTLGGPGIAVTAAQNYRRLRALGVTVRKTVDTLIATRCIEDGLELLHDDRDFDAFEAHLGLRCVRSDV